MTGAFDKQFAGDGRARIKGRVDPGVLAACSDHPAEAAVIGALLRDSALIDVAADRLRSDEFSDPVLASVFSVMAAMHAAGQTAAPITVARRLKDDTDLTERGGARYLAELAAADTADRGMGYVDHLVDLSRRRYVATGLAEMRGDIADTGTPLETSIGGIEAVLSGALLWNGSRPAVTFADAWRDAILRVEAIGSGKVQRGTDIAGFEEWNEITGGMEPGQLILLGGRPGMGKTSVAQRVARGAAEAGHGTLFISREMPVAQLMTRLVADMLYEAGGAATFHEIKRGEMSREDYRLAVEIGDRIAEWPLRFEEPEQLNASLVGPIIRRHQRELATRGQTLKVVIIDYIALLEAPQNRSSREQEMSDISRELKSVARATGTTIIALAQLNRSVEQREDKRPMLSDLRDSGSLEQDADTVIFAYRAQYYLEQREPDPSDEKKRSAWEVEMGFERDRLDIYSAKVRQDSKQRRKVYWFGDRQAIRSADFYQANRGNQESPK